METYSVLSLTLDELRDLIASAVKLALADWSKEQQSAEPPKSPDRLLTRKEASEYLHVSAPTLLALEQRGELRPGRAGRRVLYRLSDLDRVLFGDKIKRRRW